MMIKQFQNIPSALQKQILIRLAGTGLGVIMIMLVLAYRGSIQLLMPGIAISLTFLAGALNLYYRCVEGRYVVLHGVCESVDRSRLRRRLKSIQIRCGDKTIQFSAQQHLFRHVQVGNVLAVYIADSAPVYENDGIHVITNILAIRKER